MKEKMKNKFKKKNTVLSDKLGVDKIVVEENKKGTESCIYCLKPIEENEITKPFVIIGDFLYDNYTSNAFFQAIKKEYKIHYDKDTKLLPFEGVYYQPLERRSIRIISCNHYIHFHCFFNKFMDSDLLNSLCIFSCPLCNRLNETYVPMLVQYKDERTKDYFKGFDFNVIFQYGKEHIEDYEEKEEKEENEDKEEIEEKKEEEDINEKKVVNEEAEKFRKKYPDLVNSCKHFV